MREYGVEEERRLARKLERRSADTRVYSELVRKRLSVISGVLIAALFVVLISSIS